MWATRLCGLLAVARLRQCRRARRAASTNGRPKAGARDLARRAVPAAIFVAAPREGLSSIAAVKRHRARRRRDGECAGSIPSRAGAPPLRRPGRVAGSVNVSAATLVDPRPRLHHARRRAAKFAAQGVSKTTQRSAIRAAAYRPPSTCSCCTSSATTTSHALRRLDGRVGEDRVAGRRDGLIERAAHSLPARSAGWGAVLRRRRVMSTVALP